MDENGIPETAKRRYDLIKDLMYEALELGLTHDDLLADPVVLSLASSGDKVRITFDTIELLNSFHIPTTMGLSNISFGLPDRRIVNVAFMALAIGAGMDAVSCDPTESALVGVALAAEALEGRDEFCMNYISAARSGLLA